MIVKPAGDRDAELRHLREPDALAAEQLAPAVGGLVEVVDVLRSCMRNDLSMPAQEKRSNAPRGVGEPCRGLDPLRAHARPRRVVRARVAAALLELLPPPGGRALELGCGEGRVARALAEHGYRIVGVDTSEGAVAAAEGVEALVADAAELPFEDGAFDLVYAFMSLLNVDELDRAVAEAARVLEPGGAFCFLTSHPFGMAGRFAEPDDPALRTSSPRATSASGAACSRRRQGRRVHVRRPVPPARDYFRALERAGLVVEALREPQPSPEVFAARPRAARWLRVPCFVAVRARKP